MNELINRIKYAISLFEVQNAEALTQELASIERAIKSQIINMNEIMIDFSFFLIHLISQNIPNQNNEIIFLSLKILLQFLYYSDSLIDILLNNGYLDLFLSLLEYPNNNVIPNASVYILVLFFSTKNYIDIIFNSSTFHRLCHIIQHCLAGPIEINRQFLEMITQSFINIAANINNAPNDYFQMICQIYCDSLALKFYDIIGNITKFISTLIQKKNLQWISLFLQNGIVKYIFENLMSEQESEKNSRYYSYLFFATFTRNMLTTNYAYFKEIVDVFKMCQMICLEKITAPYLKYGISIIEDVIVLEDFNKEEFIQNSNILEFIRFCLIEGDFDIKYASAHLVFNTLQSSEINLIRRFFTNDITILSLDILDCGKPEFIYNILLILHSVVRQINDFGAEKYEFYILFENRFFEILKELEEFPDDRIKVAVKDMEIIFCPDRNMQECSTIYCY